MKKLGDLPSSIDNKFWVGETNNHVVEPPREHEHYLELVQGNSAECKVCGWGIFLDSHDIIFEGHLYRDGELIV